MSTIDTVDAYVSLAMRRARAAAQSAWWRAEHAATPRARLWYTDRCTALEREIDALAGRFGEPIDVLFGGAS